MTGLNMLAVLLLLGAFVIFPPPASAFYYDPNFGSVLTQVIFAGWLSIMLGINHFGKKVATLMSAWFKFSKRTLQ
jgi:hypothetical protein